MSGYQIDGLSFAKNRDYAQDSPQLKRSRAARGQQTAHGCANRVITTTSA